MVASLAVELKISPDAVLAMDELMFRTVIQVINDRAKEIRDAYKHNRRKHHEETPS